MASDALVVVFKKRNSAGDGEKRFYYFYAVIALSGIYGKSPRTESSTQVAIGVC